MPDYQHEWQSSSENPANYKDAIDRGVSEIKNALDPNLKALHKEPPSWEARVVEIKGCPGAVDLLLEECALEQVRCAVRDANGKPVLVFYFSKPAWKALQSIVYQL